ncbi:hypothetical protein WUBG_14163, partial [Wuchereria bancrofti]
MVINDATYLLDESLLALKKIHDIESLKESNEWSNLGDEERQMKEDALLEAKRSVRNWLILGRDTLDLFTYLTADAPEPFYEPFSFSFINDGLLPPVAPDLFGVMPEFFLENSLDFIVFLLKNNPVILLESRLDLPEQLLVFICSTHYFNNKFLAAKIVEVLFMVCPAILPAAYQFHLSVINSPLATDRLFPSLVKFYADVESTGASTEFYDKFNIRRSIQVIFRSLWESTIYRSNITSYARECSPDFIRFVNMVINDATYLLDESLLALKKIHDIESLKESNEWSNLGDEERQMKEDALLEAKRSVRNWLILGRDTLDLFTYLTADAPEPFYEP